MGERRAPPLEGRRRAVRHRLRHDHRLDRQLRVSEQQDASQQDEMLDGDETATTDSGTLEDGASVAETAADGDVAPMQVGITGARRSAAWASAALDVSPAGPTLSFGFTLEKVPGQGEDSDPIVRDGRELGLVAVFDGMGGAGGIVYETPDGPRTVSYLSSRVVRAV